MKKYECAVIFVPTVGNDVLENSTKKYAEVITSRGGTLEELDNWGKRTLAYEIDYHREGFYYFYRFEAGNDILKELNRQMRIDENILRHMVVRDHAKARSLRKPVEETVETAAAPETAPVESEGGEE